MEGPSRTTTIASALARCARILRKARIEEARRESDLLVAHALSLPLHRLLVERDAPLPPAAVRRLASGVRQRARRVPIAYVLGEREFYSLEFRVGPSVLVPRPETEHLVEEAIRYARAREGTRLRALDVGTGSGAIAVALAVNAPRFRVVAIDRSDAALRVARENARRNAVGDRVDFIRADLRDLPRSFAAGSFDSIVANPPYVAMEHVRDELAHEPRAALVSDCGPFPAVYRRLAEAAALLRAGGLFAVEVGAGQADTVVEIVRAAGGFGPVRVLPDLAGIPRVVVAERA